MTVAAMGYVLAIPLLSSAVSLILDRGFLMTCPAPVAAGIKTRLRTVGVGSAILMTIQALQAVMHGMLQVVQVICFMRTYVVTVRAGGAVDDFIVIRVLSRHRNGY
jgi:hypothetical protein